VPNSLLPSMAITMTKSTIAADVMPAYVVAGN